jgi:hypothetical protein
MPGVYRQKKCKNCGIIHRRRGPFCCSSCSSTYNTKNHKINGMPVKEWMSQQAKKYNAWYRSLSQQQKLQIQDSRENKKLIKLLKEVVNSCNSIIENTKHIITTPPDMKLIQLIYDASPKGYDVDHIIPKARGGEHHQDNLRYMKLEHNRGIKNSKLDCEVEQDLDIIEWKEFIEYNEEDGYWYIKESVIKEALKPYDDIASKVKQTDRIIDSLISKEIPDNNEQGIYDFIESSNRIGRE